jgi:hypothetical protein
MAIAIKKYEMFDAQISILIPEGIIFNQFTILMAFSTRS